MPQTPSGPLPGTATKQITVGRYVLTVGAPAGTIIVPTRRTVTFRADEIATFMCQLDGETSVTCASPHTFADLGGGGHVIGIRATDEAGNKGKEATAKAVVGTD